MVVSSMSEDILIITYSMIPYAPSWGECQRMYYLSNYLQTNGYNVFLISYKGYYYGDFGEKILFNSFLIENKYINSIRPKPSTKKVHNKNLIGLFRRLMKSPILLLEKEIYNERPGDAIIGKLFIKKALNDIEHILKENNIKKVIISAPPFTLFELAEILRKRDPSIKIILDYRDPWNLWSEGSIISNGLERRYLHLADKVIFVNDVLMEDTIKYFDLDRNKCDVVFNGYSELSWEHVMEKYKKINSGREELIISHIGHISLRSLGSHGNYRDPTNFFEAIDNCKHKAIIKLRFIGVDETKKLENLEKRLNIHIDAIPAVSHEESLEYMLESDILLLIHTDVNSSKYILTGKLFDYARSGKVILGIGNESAYFIKFINQYGLGITASNNISSIQSALESIHCNWEKGILDNLKKEPDKNLKYISGYSRESQNHKFLNIISHIK